MATVLRAKVETVPEIHSAEINYLIVCGNHYHVVTVVRTEFQTLDGASECFDELDGRIIAEGLIPALLKYSIGASE